MKVVFKLISPVFLAALCAINSGSVFADSFDDAVNEYIKGYKECTEANTLRSTDLAAAKKKFAAYLQFLNKAKAIDPSILTSTARDMDSNLRYCERVEVNIKRAEATPILEQGFTHCDTAKEALKNNDVPTANENMNQYVHYRDQAMGITDSLMEVFALSSKVRACGRVQEKLAEAMKEENAITAKMNTAIQGYQSVQAQCEKARTTITSAQFNLNQLDSVNDMMNGADKAKKAARTNTEAYIILEQQPNRAQSKQLQQLIDSSAQCESQTSDLIRTATKNKRELEKQITDAVATLRASQDACNSAKTIAGRYTSNADVAKSEAELKRSATLQDKVTSDATVQGLVKKYPDWNASKQFTQLSASVDSCQGTVATTIPKQKAAFATAQQKAKDDAAKQAKLERDRKARADAQAQKEAEEAKRLAEKKRAEAEARRRAEAEARRAASLDDVDTNVDDDEFGDFGDDDKDSNGKSWTDLVK